MSIFSAVSDQQMTPMYVNYHRALYEIEEEMEMGAYREFNKCDSVIDGAAYAFVVAGVMVISAIAHAIFGSFGRALLATAQTGTNLLLFIPSILISCCVDSEHGLHIKQVALHILEGTGHFALAFVEWIPFFWHAVEAAHVDMTGKHTPWYQEPSAAEMLHYPKPFAEV